MPSVGGTHHVKLGTQYLTIRPNSYIKRPAPQFGARFTSGDPDFNSLSIWQHWAQKCWVGGMDAEEWTDDAMYDDGVGVNTWSHESVTVARDLLKGSGSNWTFTGDSASCPRTFIVYNSTLYCLNRTALTTLSTLYKYTPSTEAWSAVTAFAAGFTARSIATFDGKLYVGGINAGVPKLYYGSGALGSWTLITNPAGVTGGIYSMRSFGGKMYVAYGAQVWRGKDDQTWDGTTVFYKANMNSDSNVIQSMETHLGFLYMLSQNGHLHRTDGNNTFDIWSWDGGTIGIALRSYDGKLFVATYEYVDTAEAGFGVLYQFTGSAVTQLKRWGKDSEVTSLGSLMVHDRKLFYGASNLLGIRAGFGVAMYDAIEDSHSIFASNGDTTSFPRGSTPFVADAVDDVIVFGGNMFCSVRTHGLFKTKYQYRDIPRTVARYDISYAGGSLASLNGGWFTTSTYDAGTAGLKKLWRKVVVDAKLPSSATGIVVEYSTDTGLTWTLLGTLTFVSVAQRKNYAFYLNASATSFKLRFTLRTTSATVTPTLYGFVVSYIPIPEPNWMWNFTALIGEKVQLMDGTMETVDTTTMIAYFEDLYRALALTTFQDIDGTLWATGGQAGVLIYDMTISVGTLTTPYEATISFTLLEAAETY